MENIVNDLSKKFAVEVMSDETPDHTPYYIPFNHKGLQAITGGVPGGCVTEVIAKSAAGKSYLLYELGMGTLNMGGVFKLDDIERAYRTVYGKRVGLDGDKKFTLGYEKEMERIFLANREFVKRVRDVNTECPILIGIDSYPPIQTLVSKKEIEEQLKKGTAKELKGYRDAKKNALFAALIGEWVTFADEHKVTTVLLNQTRYAMNVMFGDNQTSNADNILQYYVSLRLRGKIVGKIKSKTNDGKIIGVRTEWETIKNRNVYPYKKATTSILFKSGISKYSGLRELLISEGIGGNVPRKPKCIKYGNKVYPINKLVIKKPEVLDLRDT